MITNVKYVQRSSRINVGWSAISTDRPFGCPHCNFHQKTRGALQRHMCYHYRPLIKTHRCPICGKWLESHKDFESHVVTHPEAHGKPYHCQTCSRRFLRKQELNMHLMSKKYKQCLLAVKQQQNTFWWCGCLKAKNAECGNEKESSRCPGGLFIYSIIIISFYRNMTEGQKDWCNRSPKGNIWSAIPFALLWVIVSWNEGKQGSGPEGDEVL